MPLYNDNREPEILKMAKQTGWELTKETPATTFLRFEKDGMIIDVWWKKMTVGVYLEKTIKYYYEVMLDEVIELFLSPINFEFAGKIKSVKR